METRIMTSKEHPDGYWGDEQWMKDKWRTTRFMGNKSVAQIRKKNRRAKFRTIRPSGVEEV